MEYWWVWAEAMCTFWQRRPKICTVITHNNYRIMRNTLSAAVAATRTKQLGARIHLSAEKHTAFAVGGGGRRLSRGGEGLQATWGTSVTDTHLLFMLACDICSSQRGNRGTDWDICSRLTSETNTATAKGLRLLVMTVNLITKRANHLQVL